MRNSILYISLSILMLSCHAGKQSLNEVVSQDTPITNDFLQEGSVKLAQPHIEIDSIFFRHSAHINLDFGLDDSECKYAIYDSPVFKNYEKPVLISESTKVQVFTHKENFESSDTTTTQLIKIKDDCSHAAVQIKPEPHANYPGNGIASLTDLKKGSVSFRDGNKWLGFQSEEVVVEMDFEEPKEMSQIYISCLSDHNSWIFKPVKIFVFKDGKPFAIKSYDLPEANQNASLEIIPIETVKGKYNKLKIVIVSNHQIPEWHPGKGTPPWLFIDEIIVQ